MFTPPIPAPINGNIKNQTSATVSAAIKINGLAQFGPHSYGAIPAHIGYKTAANYLHNIADFPIDFPVAKELDAVPWSRVISAASVVSAFSFLSAIVAVLN